MTGQRQVEDAEQYESDGLTSTWYLTHLHAQDRSHTCKKTRGSLGSRGVRCLIQDGANAWIARAMASPSIDSNSGSVMSTMSGRVQLVALLKSDSNVPRGTVMDTRKE